jgi:hypothetical protein
VNGLMKLTVVVAAFLAFSTRADAQDVFVAPTPHSILMSMEASHGSDKAQSLIVKNESTIPIIVKGVKLYSCENIRQSCTGEDLNILVPPGQQRTVFRVYPQAVERAPTFRWRVMWHADSSNVKAMELLRANSGQVQPPPPDTSTHPI